MLIVPISPVPSQTLQVQLADQPFVLNFYQTAYGLFADVYLGAEAVVLGVIAENLNRLVRYAYLGITGDFIFVDTQGENDPVYTGLGSRYLLIYLTEEEIAAAATG